MGAFLSFTFPLKGPRVPSHHPCSNKCEVDSGIPASFIMMVVSLFHGNVRQN